MKGDQLDLSSEPPSDRSDSGDPVPTGRRFVGIRFECCDVYTRIYINRDETAYEGACPKCSRRVRLAIGPGGTDSRFFTVK